MNKENKGENGRCTKSAQSDGSVNCEIREKVLKLRCEVNCRIEHGAESGGHLDYVQKALDEILEPND